MLLQWKCLKRWSDLVYFLTYLGLVLAALANMGFVVIV